MQSASTSIFKITSMKSSFARWSYVAQILLVLLMALPSASHAQLGPPSEPFIAQCELDQDRCHWLAFPTKVGWHYAVEESSDLESFFVATGGNYYGDGTTKRFFLYQDPPPSVADPNAAPPRPSKFVHITLFISTTAGVDRAIAVRQPTITSPGWSWELGVALPQRSMGCFFTKEMPDARWHVWVFAEPRANEHLPTMPAGQTWDAVSLDEKAAFLESLDQVSGGITQATDVTLPTTPPSSDSGQRVFYRVTELGIDTNGNGLYDWWENQYGYNAFHTTTDPRAANPDADDDTDGLTNIQEQAAGTLANDSDTDKDGFLDGEEPDPKDATKHPPPVTYLLVATRELLYFQITPGYVRQKTTNWGDDFLTEFFALNQYSSASAMVETLAAIAFPENTTGVNERGVGNQTGGAVVDGMFGKLTDSSGEIINAGGIVTHTRVWLVHKPIETVSLTANYFLTASRQVPSPTTYAEPTVVSLTIDAGKTISDSLDLKPELNPDPAGDTYFIQATKELSAGLTIYNGQNAITPVADTAKETVGAFTVANHNDTDGDGTVDKDDNEVKVPAPPSGPPNNPNTSGVSDEIDLMKLVISGPNRGKMKLTVESGSIKLWAKPTKETAITLTDGKLTVPSAELPKTVWIEATSVSATMRDIVIKVGHEDPTGKFTDDLATVKATAVWVTQKRFLNSGHEMPSEIDNPTFIQFFQNDFNSQWGVQSAGSPPDFQLAECLEFLILPAGAALENGVIWDIARQRKTRVWLKKVDGTKALSAVAPFPNGDIGNDGPAGGSEDDEPNGDHIYSFDSPVLTQEILAAQQVNGVIRVKQMGNFKEFARVKFDKSTFIENNVDPVKALYPQGSRCSDKFLWQARGDVSFAGTTWERTLGGENLVETGNNEFTDPE
jgi:hypothetical protein